MYYIYKKQRPCAKLLAVFTECVRYTYPSAGITDHMFHEYVRAILVLFTVGADLGWTHRTFDATVIRLFDLYSFERMSVESYYCIKSSVARY